MFKAKPLKSGAASLGLKLGRGVPKELLSTIEVYAPFAVNDEAQAAAAAEAFQLLDPDVNGWSDQEGWRHYVQAMLRRANPKKQKGGGKAKAKTKATAAATATAAGDNEEAEPVAIYAPLAAALPLAFEKAAAWKRPDEDAATAAVEGVDSAGRVSLKQFRMANTLLCAHAAMNEAFFAVCQDRSPGARISVEQWTARCLKVLPFGFEGFSMMTELQRNKIGLAAFFFNNLDSSEDKTVDINEWYAYITRTEAEAKTPLGERLTEPPPPKTAAEIEADEKREALRRSNEEKERQRKEEEEEERKRRKLTVIALRKQRAEEVKFAAQAAKERREAEAKAEEERKVREAEEAEEARKAARWQAKTHHFLEGDSWGLPVCCLVLASTALTQYVAMKGGAAVVPPPPPPVDDWDSNSSNLWYPPTSSSTSTSAFAVAAGNATNSSSSNNNNSSSVVVPPMVYVGGPNGLAVPATMAEYVSECSATCACACAPSAAPTVAPTVAPPGSDVILCAKLVVLISIFFFFEVTTRLYCWRVVHGELSTFFVKDITPSMPDEDDGEDADEETGVGEAAGEIPPPPPPLPPPPQSKLSRVQFLNVIDVVVVGSDVFFFLMTLLSNAGPCSFVMARFARLLRLFKCGKALKMAKMMKVQAATSKLKSSNLAKRASIFDPNTRMQEQQNRMNAKMQAKQNEMQAKVNSKIPKTPSMNIPTAPNVPKMPAAPNMKMPAAPNMKVPTAPSGPAFSRRANGFQQLPTHDPDDYLDNGNDHEGKDRCCIPPRRSRGSGGGPEKNSEEDGASADAAAQKQQQWSSRQRQRLTAVLRESLALATETSTHALSPLHNGGGLDGASSSRNGSGLSSSSSSSSSSSNGTSRSSGGGGGLPQRVVICVNLLGSDEGYGGYGAGGRSAGDAYDYDPYDDVCAVAKELDLLDYVHVCNAVVAEHDRGNRNSGSGGGGRREDDLNGNNGGGNEERKGPDGPGDRGGQGEHGSVLPPTTAVEVAVFELSVAPRAMAARAGSSSSSSSRPPLERQRRLSPPPAARRRQRQQQSHRTPHRMHQIDDATPVSAELLSVPSSSSRMGVEEDLDDDGDSGEDLDGALIERLLDEEHGQEDPDQEEARRRARKVAGGGVGGSEVI